MNFLNFSKGFIRRKNPLKAFAQEIVEVMKDFLTIHKKLKMSKYRLSYHMHQFNKMESLIALNNEHTFLRGKKLNQIR